MSLGKLWAEFKEFAFKGNMIELAVAVVIGAAFGKVINSLVDDLIMPTVAYTIHTGEQVAEKAKDVAANATGLATTQPATAPVAGVPPVPAAAAGAPAPAPAPAPAAAAAPPPTEPVSIDLNIGPVPVGKFIGALLNFVIVAFAVFIMIVKLLGGVMKRMQKPVAPGEPTTRECPECLSIIPIKARRCSHCTAVIAPGAV
jgi:large conductance mechanosensitive channel